ncbi:hypothetical protein GEMRC1_011670 [Eukaryota sp. GEM-RC1]
MPLHVLKPSEELRFVIKDEPCTLKLEEGLAELFGTELALGKSYVLKDRVAAVFSYQGAKISIIGQPDELYITSDTSMNLYLDFHAEVEAKRSEARSTEGRGPRILVTGPMDSGKSTLTQILTSYAVRCDRTPVVVDLDVGQNHLSIPGTVAASLFDQPVDVETGLDSTDPLVFWFGHTSPSKNLSHYKYLINQLATAVDMRCEQDARVLDSGIIVNTSGWVDDEGFDLLVDAIKVLEIDYVLVLGRDLLRVKLERMFDRKSGVEIRGLAVSPGVVSRNRDTRKSYRKSRIHRYFYGFNMELAPDLFQISFSRVCVFGVESSRLSERLRPIGSEQKLEETMVKILPQDQFDVLRQSVLLLALLNQLNRFWTSLLLVLLLFRVLTLSLSSWRS